MAQGTRGRWRSIKAFWFSLREHILQRRDTQDNNVRRHFRAGVRAIHEARWAEAEVAFSRVLSSQADHFLAHLYKGVAIYHQGRHAEAHTALLRAQRLNPRRFSVYQTSNSVPATSPPANLQGDLLRDLVRNLERSAHDLRETAERIHDVSQRQQRAIKRLHILEAHRGFMVGGRRRRGKASKPRASAFSSYEEAKKFRDMPSITEDDVINTNWDELIARILE